jgi:uncharacterized protein (TIGR03086 family)
MDVLAQWDVVVPEFQRIVATTKPDQLDDQTPCTEWKVRDLFGHLLGGATMFAPMIRGDEPPATPPSPSDDDLTSAVAAAVSDVDAAWRTPGALDRVIATPLGDMQGEAFARLLAFDLLMHTWDLATTTGQSVDVPVDVVGAIDEFARQAVSDDLRQPGLFGPEVTAAPDAAPLDRLVAFSGRTR